MVSKSYYQVSKITAQETRRDELLNMLNLTDRTCE